MLLHRNGISFEKRYPWLRLPQKACPYTFRHNEKRLQGKIDLREVFSLTRSLF